MFETEGGSCPTCNGPRVQELVSFTADLGFGVVVVRKVPALSCLHCGNEWFANDTTLKLEKFVDSKRLESKEVTVAFFEELA